jgi:hypothetical protein
MFHGIYLETNIAGGVRKKISLAFDEMCAKCFNDYWRKKEGKIIKDK